MSSRQPYLAACHTRPVPARAAPGQPPAALPRESAHPHWQPLESPENAGPRRRAAGSTPWRAHQHLDPLAVEPCPDRGAQGNPHPSRVVRVADPPRSGRRVRRRPVFFFRSASSAPGRQPRRAGLGDGTADARLGRGVRLPAREDRQPRAADALPRHSPRDHLGVPRAPAVRGGAAAGPAALLTSFSCGGSSPTLGPRDAVAPVSDRNARSLHATSAAQTRRCAGSSLRRPDSVLAPDSFRRLSLGRNPTPRARRRHAPRPQGRTDAGRPPPPGPGALVSGPVVVARPGSDCAATPCARACRARRRTP